MAFNREEWFNLAVKKLTPLFICQNAEIPRDLYISVGRTTHRMTSSGTVGETWHGADKTGAVQIFISPSVNDTLEVLAILTHELVHACLGPVDGTNHGKLFRELAAGVGLVKPWTQSAPSQQLEEYFIDNIIASIGQYYQPEFDLSEAGRPGSRLIRVVCPHCGYLARTTYKWLAIGSPLCPDGYAMEAK